MPISDGPSEHLSWLELAWPGMLDGQGFSYRAATLKARDNCSVFDVQPTTPFSHWKRDSVVAKKPDLRRVVSLNNRSRPPDVARFIISVVIDSVYGVSITWPRTYVRQKSLKRLRPSFADCDSASAIQPKIQDIRIEAPSFHCFPDSVFGGSSKAMRSGPLGSFFLVKAAARLCSAIAKMVFSKAFHFPANAPTNPIPVTVFGWSGFDYCQATVGNV